MALAATYTSLTAVETHQSLIVTPTKPTLAISQPTRSSNTEPLSTPAPAFTPGPKPLPRALIKRSHPFPDFLSDVDNFYSYPYVLAACSCLITSGLPPVLSTTMFTVMEWNATTVSDFSVEFDYIDVEPWLT